VTTELYLTSFHIFVSHIYQEPKQYLIDRYSKVLQQSAKLLQSYIAFPIYNALPALLVPATSIVLEPSIKKLKRGCSKCLKQLNNLKKKDLLMLE
jgi:hypothetical protein